MIGLILAAGNNTRIAMDITFPSKALIPIGNKTLLIRNMDLLAEIVDRFVIVVGKAEKSIIKEITKSEYADRVTYVTQQVATGTLDAMRLALPYIDDNDVFLVLGDEFLINDRIKDMTSNHYEKKVDISVGIVPNSDDFYIKEAFTLQYNYGYVTTFIEKPKTIYNKDRGTGYYIINKKIIQSIAEIRSERKDIVDLFNHAIEKGCTAISFDIADEEYNINTKVQLDRATEAFVNNQIKLRNCPHPCNRTEHTGSMSEGLPIRKH